MLPKFKVAVDFGAESKAKRGYRPGDHVTGTVRANYFFGKAVDDGEVTVKASGMDVAMFEAGSRARQDGWRWGVPFRLTAARLTSPGGRSARARRAC